MKAGRDFAPTNASAGSTFRRADSFKCNYGAAEDVYEHL